MYIFYSYESSSKAVINRLVPCAHISTLLNVTHTHLHTLTHIHTNKYTYTIYIHIVCSFESLSISTLHNSITMMRFMKVISVYDNVYNVFDMFLPPEFK